jgi:hypothetical protein
MQRSFGFSYPNAKFMPVLTEVEGYDLTEISVPSQQLANDKVTQFDVNLPYNSNYSFLGSQFIKVKTNKPELEDPTQVPRGYVVRFWYCPKTGIRLLNKVAAMSDISEFDGYHHRDVLKYENDCLTDNLYELWNRLIGNDLGTQANVYNVMSETTEVVTIKDGYQTGKADPDPLTVYIPLLFSYNRNLNDKINLSAFNKNTLSIKGEFQHNNLIIRAAAFDPNNLQAAPIPLAVKPLVIDQCSLLGLFTALDDVMFALNMQLYYNHLYSYIKSHSYAVKESNVEVKLRSREESLQMAVIARPKWYANDFDLWTEFTPIKKVCYPVPIAQLDPLTGNYKVAIQGAELNKSVEPFKYINLFYDGICMMADGTKDGTGDPKIWSEIDVFSKSMRYLDYRVRKFGMTYFNFNPHVNTKKISFIYNFGKMDGSILRIRFSDEIPTNPNNGALSEEYEIITFSEALNFHLASGDAMVKTVITS